MKEKHLQKEFGKFGKIVEVNVPLKNEKGVNRGFGFVEFDTKEEAQKAIDAMNNKQWKGRTLALEFSVPKGSYESKIVKIVEHTNLGRGDAILPKVLRDEKRQREEEKEKMEAEKREYEEKNAKKIKKQEKKKAKKEAKKQDAKKQHEQQVESATLFVRNIGFETDEAKFKEFMEKFGPVKYAVLCKTNEIAKKDEAATDKDSQPTHKGTGFVKFRTKEAAAQLLELSRKVEEQMDEERKNSRLKKTSKQDLVSSLSLLKNEIELGGRRLIVKESVSKDEAGVLKEKQKAEDLRKKQE